MRFQLIILRGYASKFVLYEGKNILLKKRFNNTDTETVRGGSFADVIIITLYGL